MVIRIEKKGSDAFYKETISATYQYRELLKNPEKKLRNVFKQLELYMIVCAFFGIAVTATGFAWGFDALTIVAAAVMFIVLGVSIMYHKALRTMKNKLRDDPRTGVLTLDEQGVELNKEDGQVLRFSWDNIAFVRAFDESVIFFAKEVTSLVISVTKEYRGEIFDYLQKEQPGVRLIG